MIKLPRHARIESDGLIRRKNTMALMLGIELEALIESIPETGLFLEIGTRHGLSAAIVGHHRPRATIYSVDPLYGHNNAKWQSNRLPNMRLLIGTVDDLDLGQVILFDAILVDGDHSAEPCYNDLRISTRLLKPGGVLMAHDYQAVPGTHVKGQAGVKTAVDRFCKSHGYRVARVVGSLAFIERK